MCGTTGLVICSSTILRLTKVVLAVLYMLATNESVLRLYRTGNLPGEGAVKVAPCLLSSEM